MDRTRGTAMINISRLLNYVNGQKEPEKWRFNSS